MNLPCEIWVVFGTTGEYSDHSQWMIAAYPSKELAEQHASLCRKWYDDNGGIKIRETMFTNPAKNPYDENMSVDNTGTIWSVFPLTLRKELPGRSLVT